MLVRPFIHEGEVITPKVNLNPRLSLKWGIILTVIITLWILYFMMPVLNLRFGIYLTAAFALFPLFLTARLRKPVIYIYTLLAVVFIIMLLITLPLFRAKDYRNLIGKVQSTQFTDLISPVALDQVPVVDPAYALMLGEKKLGDDFALGSRVTLGHPTRQMVNGKLLFAIPLLHSGFFKWLTNLDGTPAYIVVSATNPQDVKLVREANNQPVRIKYQPNAFFQQNLRRKLYQSGLMTVGITDYTFELDDSGVPYWTASVYKKKIGFSGKDVIGAALVRCDTGEVTYYERDKVPGWVDRIEPADFIMTQLNWWGGYVHGFWNTVFGKRDMLMTTSGYNIIYSNDGKCYFYTGLSSVGADEGAVGFSLINTRNKMTHLYQLSGATETAAMQSAEGKVQNYKYSATFPILLNISGLPTYFITLKDQAGLVKLYAMVSVRDYSVVGVGETVKSTRDSYLMVVSSSRGGNLPYTTQKKVEMTGNVTRIGSDIRDGRSFYYLTLDNLPGKVLVANTDLSTILPVTKPGDNVQVSFIETQDVQVNLSQFENLSVK